MFTLPLYDDNPRFGPAFVTWTLIALNVLVFLWQQSLSPAAEEAAIYALGVVPAVLFGYAELPAELALIPAWASILTSMFMHGGWAHLAGNMLYLWIFGDNTEESMGHGRFLIFYLLCGAVAAFAQSVIDPASEIPMVGASGAIAGILGGYIILHPHAKVRVFLLIVVFVRLIWVPAWIVLGLWFLMQIVSGAVSSGEGGGIAFWAHAGGFVAGMMLIVVFKRSGVPLFEPSHTRAFSTEPGPPRRGSVPVVRSRAPDRRGWPFD